MNHEKITPLDEITTAARRARSLQAEINAAGFGPPDLKAELTQARQRIAELEAILHDHWPEADWLEVHSALEAAHRRIAELKARNRELCRVLLNLVQQIKFAADAGLL
jgi:hypothetical protein